MTGFAVHPVTLRDTVIAVLGDKIRHSAVRLGELTVEVRAADYLAAQKDLSKYPEEVFGQILEDKDLNPFVVHGWTAWLAANPGITPTDEVLRRPDSPCFVPDEHIANNEMYFPTGVTTELWKAQAEVDRHLLKNSSAPAHATILAERPLPGTARVFLRGNPLTKGESVPLVARGTQIYDARRGGLPGRDCVCRIPSIRRAS